MGLLDGDIAELIGDALSDIFLDATLTRDVAPTDPGTPFDPNPSTETTTFTCKAMHAQWSSYLIAQGMVKSDEVQLIILATSLATLPTYYDRVTIREKTFTIIDGKSAGMPAVSRDPADAAWTCRART